jgi:hypothetical protein
MKSVAFKPGTQSGPFSASEWESFIRMMKVDCPDFAFDEHYARFIEAGGGVPVENLFRVDGCWCPIERFLNFANGAGDLPFNVHQNWILIEDRLDAGQFPFASLPGGDFLIFDHQPEEVPRVMMWFHEKSSDGRPYLEFIAESIEEFIDQLRPAHATEYEENTAG